MQLASHVRNGIAAYVTAFAAARTLWFDQGHLRGCRERVSVDRDGHPVPWYTYPAIEYLKQLEYFDKDVFEYGSGQSTLFWAERARRVVTVEDDEAWYAIVSQKIPGNCELVLETDLSEYARYIHRYPGGFDVIVVDGAARGKTRLKCCQAALQALRPGGMIVLDNADWLPRSAELLRDSGLIEVDMTGLVPLAGHTQTTSLFLHRAFSFAPRGRQPAPGPGASMRNWERGTPIERPIVEFAGEVYGAVTDDIPFEKGTDHGVRHFRLVCCAATAERPAAAGILDVDRQRVLLSLNEPTAGGVVAADACAELSSVLSMSWGDFQSFVCRHPKRRYLLQP
jgi:methyltransferase family protein